MGRQTQAKQAQTWILAALLVTAVAGAQSRILPAEPLHDSGQSVTAAFEGWFPNPDGTFSILLGYFNRNLKEELDIPIGPNNRIEPGGPDQGQPTHFMPRRNWGVFTVTVPKDFGDKKVTWTLTANHQTTAIPVSLDPLWEIQPFHEEGIGNTPPVLRFEETGPSVQGPRAIVANLSGNARVPVPLKLWVTDDAKAIAGRAFGPAVVLTWSKFRGPGTVTFANPRPPVEASQPVPFSGTATTTATFSEPGEYVLRVVANDWSGDGGRGFQCCWTNGQIKVSIK